VHEADEVPSVSEAMIVTHLLEDLDGAINIRPDIVVRKRRGARPEFQSLHLGPPFHAHVSRSVRLLLEPIQHVAGSFQVAY
jgi:hypothetical protein